MDGLRAIQQREKARLKQDIAKALKVLEVALSDYGLDKDVLEPVKLQLGQRNLVETETIQ